MLDMKCQVNDTKYLTTSNLQHQREMKTPLQKLIEKWEEDAGYVRPGKIHTHAPIFQAFIDDARAMLEEEREVIENAYRSNCSECTRHEITKCDVKT